MTPVTSSASLAEGTFRLNCRVQGRSLTLLLHRTHIFFPNLMSWFSAAQMHVVPGEIFCDVGTGSGLHAILAAKLGARRVYGTDLSPFALRLARLNARANGVGRVCRFLQGSLVSPLTSRGVRVDAMVYNAPQFPGRLVEPGLPPALRLAVDGGPGGEDLNARFLREASRALAPRGRIYEPVVDWSSPRLAWRCIRRNGYRAHEVARIHVPAWGRGNNTRRRLIDRPGSYSFGFRHARGRDTAAVLLELRRDGLPPVAERKPLPVRVAFGASR